MKKINETVDLIKYYLSKDNVKNAEYLIVDLQNQLREYKKNKRNESGG